MFANREAPEGFVFPACSTCNSGYRLEDQISGLIAALAGSQSLETHRQWQKLLEGVRNNQPQHLPTVDLSANDKRKILVDLGIDKEPGSAFADVPLVAIPVGVRATIERWLRKMLLAIYYREQGAIFAPSGLVSSIVIFNAYLLRKKDPIVLPRFCNIRRTSLRGRDMSDEFSYNWEFDAQNGVFGAAAFFHRGFVGVMSGVFRKTSIDAGNELPWYDLTGNVVVPDPSGERSVSQ